MSQLHHTARPPGPAVICTTSNGQGVPLVTQPKPTPAYLTPFWLVDHSTRAFERFHRYEELGSDPDLCPDYAAAVRAYGDELTDVLEPAVNAAAERAIKARERLAVCGLATLEDTLRLMDAEGVSVEYSDIPLPCSLRGERPRLLMPEARTPEQDLSRLAWGLGSVLCIQVWLGFSVRWSEPQPAIKAVWKWQTLVARTFADHWLLGAEEAQERARVTPC